MVTERRQVIVYVEDNQTNLELVTRVLEAGGRFRVVGAPDGPQGLEAVARERPSLVLVDLDVPIINGFEITRRLKASPDAAVRAIPVIAISANVLKNERQAALDAGCVTFIEKPFDIHELRREVERALAAV